MTTDWFGYTQRQRFRQNLFSLLDVGRTQKKIVHRFFFSSDRMASIKSNDSKIRLEGRDRQTFHVESNKKKSE